MAAVLLVSFYIGGEENEARDWYWNIFAWLVGFIVYQVTVNLDSIFLGPSLLAIIASGALAYIWILVKRYNLRLKSS